MAWHTAAYTLSYTGANTLTQLTPATDQVLVQQNTGYLVSQPLNNIGAVHGNGTTLTQLQFQAPSLRRLWYLDASPLMVSALPTPPLYIHDRMHTPYHIDPNDFIQAWVAHSAAGAEQDYAFLYLIDGPVVPYSGNWLTLRATGTTTLVANAWTLVPLTLSQQLLPGQYQIIGCLAQSTSCLAARFVMPGYSWRPGVPGSTVKGVSGYFRFRFGEFGSFGFTFPHNVVPQMEFFATAADTAQEVYLDLVKVA